MTQRLSFRYYNSGIRIADFVVSESGIFFKAIDDVIAAAPHTSRASDGEGYTLLDEVSNPYKLPEHIPVPEILKKIRDTGDASLLSGYAEYKEVEALIDGKQVKARLLVQESGVFPWDFVVVDGEIVAVLTGNGVVGAVQALVKPGFEALTSLSDFANDPLISRAVYGFGDPQTHMVKMRDGVRLATDVILPAGLGEGEKVPTVLIRTCYGKSVQKPLYFFACYGYAVVAQDVRGRDDSEGEWRPCVNEMDDGADTLDWLLSQSWCDGNIGMIGVSYLAVTQWAAAASGNPHLKALISQSTAGTAFTDFTHRNGALCSGTLAWAFATSARSVDGSLMERDDWEEILDTRPLTDIPIKALGHDVPFLTEWIEHEYKDEYWKRGDWSEHALKIDVPALYISGWYDDSSMGTSQMWRMNRENGRENQKLLIGPWRHKFNVSRDIHGINFGSSAIRHDLFYVYLRWFDRFLKGIENGIDEETPVEYYINGKNEWRESKTWPPSESKEVSWCLASEGCANTSAGDGALLSNFEVAGVSLGCSNTSAGDGALHAGGAEGLPPYTIDIDTAEHIGTSKDHYSFDPDDPAPHLITMSENECMVPENYREVELRDDVLVYTSQVLKEDLIIAGEPRVVLYASTSAKDTDWVARLTDVDEKGNSIRLSDGIVRARFRNSFETPSLLAPGSIEKYDIPMTWISNMFKKGHRIRVEITSGAKYSIFPNGNTGGSIASDVKTIKARQTVYHSEEYPSRIILPVLLPRRTNIAHHANLSSVGVNIPSARQ